jgi:hypothetical protein
MSAAAKAEGARLEGNDAMRRRDYNAAFNCYTVPTSDLERCCVLDARRILLSLLLSAA